MRFLNFTGLFVYVMSCHKDSWFWQKNKFSTEIIFSQRIFAFCKKRLLLGEKIQAWKLIFSFFFTSTVPQIPVAERLLCSFMPAWEAISFSFHRQSFLITVKHVSPCLALHSNCQCTTEMSVYMYIHINPTVCYCLVYLIEEEKKKVYSLIPV